MDFQHTRLIGGLLLLTLGSSCHREPQEVSQSAFSVAARAMVNGHEQVLEYVSQDGSFPVLTQDGVHFELRDAAVYRIDWDVLGAGGSITTHASQLDERNVPVSGALLAVLGQAVDVREGRLWWGEEDLGPVEPGSTVIVDAEGVHRQE